MRKVATLVVDWVPTLIVTLTFSDFPFMVLGIANDSFAVPALNHSECVSTLPLTDGSQTIFPVVSGAPVSFRVTGKLTVKLLPAIAFTGVVFATPMIAFSGRLCVVFVGVVVVVGGGTGA